MTKIIFIFCLHLLAVSTFSQIKITGTVYDSTSYEPLPFVNISVKDQSNGASTSLSGKFELSVDRLPVTLVFSYVGYEKKTIIVSQNKPLKIYLKNNGIDLGEATVLSDYNPALDILKKVVANSQKNNPEKNGSFSYTSYTKMIFTVAADSVQWSEKGKELTDEEEKKMIRFFEKQHLFMSECISERKFLDANHQKETILASKVSGFGTPIFNLISTQFQSFHFYSDEIALADVKYVGPVSAHGLKHYQYKLQDTFYLEKDTVFAISFRPYNENSPQSMRGVLQIHTNGYAVYNVIAEPFLVLETGFGIKISQQYRLIENKLWFPEELNSKIIFYNAKIGETPTMGIGTGKIRDIKLNPDFSKNEFDEFEVVTAGDFNSTAFTLDKMRIDSLTKKEKETYRVVDSLGQKHHFDKKMMAFQSLFNGYVPLKFLDWDLTKLMNYNEYEGFRLGMALRTNRKISKYVSVGGYFAYGFGDRAFKKGADLNFLFSEKRQFEFNLSARNDVEAASVISSYQQQRYLMTQGYSALFYNRFDSVMRYEGRISLRAFRHFKFHFFADYQNRKSYGDYSYAVPLTNEITFQDSDFLLFETGVEIKMALHEKFTETPFGYLSTGTKWPLVILRFTKGLKNIYGSEFDYERITLKCDYQINDLRWGNYYFSLRAGRVTGIAPYHLLFNPAGTYKPINKITVYSMDGFETMRLNELLYDEFYSFHFRYRFSKAIINGKKFRPLLSLTTSIANGRFDSQNLHTNINYTVLDKPFTESGLVIDNLIKSGVSGIGIGFFYRWGAWQYPYFKDNYALKISLSLSLG